MSVLEEVDRYFHIYHIEKVSGKYRFYVVPVADYREIKKFLAKAAQEYDVSLRYVKGEYVLEFSERKAENPLVNVVLLMATIATTAYVGAHFYPEPNLVGGLMFSAAIMFVLGSHEMAHYFAARRWGMRTSLPYFIPFPSIIGTLGAVIRHRGAIPNRKALFDVGVSGPLAGVAAACVVTYIGLRLPFVARGEPTLYIGTPPIFDAVAFLASFSGEAIHPVAFAGWVGFFITFLNMLPVGQLDGGHIARAMLGRKSELISRSIPVALFTYSLYLTLKSLPSGIWFFWSILTFFFSSHPHPEPVDDDTPIDSARFAVGIVAFVLAALCFTPVPFYY